MPQQRERELKFDVDADWPLPDLAAFVPRGGRSEATVEDLRAEYHDTDDLLLRRLKITLRRRTGGHDAGWHLKLPAGEARTEVQSASRRTTLPGELSRRLAGVLAGRELRPVARLATTRQLLRLHDDADRVVVEVADDLVHGESTYADAEPLRWREVEVELGPAGTEDDLAAVADALTRAGARPGRTPSKLARVLGDPLPPPSVGPLADLVADYVREQCAAILLGDVVLRPDDSAELDEEVVHDTRVAVRRLRSTLRMFPEVLDESAAAGFDDDLRWYAGLLGDLRDADVQGVRLRAEVASLPPADVVGAVGAELDAALERHRDAAIRHWSRGRRTARCRAVLERVADWLMDVPLRQGAADLSVPDGQQVVRRARAKAARRLAVAGADPIRLHRARKAAKRLRYTADLMAPAWPKATKLARRAKHRQSVLGHHQDEVVTADFLRLEGSRPGLSSAFTWGLLTARAEHRARQARHRARDQRL